MLKPDIGQYDQRQQYLIRMLQRNGFREHNTRAQPGDVNCLVLRDDWTAYLFWGDEVRTGKVMKFSSGFLKNNLETT